MKNLPYISLIIAIVIAVNELRYISSTNLAWVIIGLCAGVALNAIVLMQKKQ